MFRDYRRIFIRVAGLIIVAALLSFLVRDLSAVDSAYRHAAANASVKYERNAEAYVKESCFSSPSLSEMDCASKADEAAREGQRKEQDLAAQNITAWWTKVMGIAAIIGMALSAIGVWLVFTTFHETKRSNEIAIADQRPWLDFKVKFDGATFSGGVLRIAYTVIIRNIGNRPAIAVAFKKIEKQDLLTGNPKRETRIFEHPDLSRGEISLLPNGEHEIPEVSRFPMEDWEIVELVAGAPFITPIIGMAVSYRWKGEAKLHSTGHWFDILFTHPDHGQVSIPTAWIVEGENERIVLKRTGPSIAD